MGRKSKVVLIEAMLSAFNALIKCYKKNYPSDRCEDCSLRAICGFLENLPEVKVGED